MEYEYKYEDLVNTEIKLDIEKLPKVLKQMVEMMEDAAKDGNWSLYYGYIDGLETVAKNSYAAGAISKDIYTKVLFKYGGKDEDI